MFKYLLIVLCLHTLHTFPTHAFNNGRLGSSYDMEMEPLEVVKTDYGRKIVKRQTNGDNIGDNEIPINDISDIVTTQKPTNVLEYLTSEQGQDSSNISVQPLEGTTNSGNISAGSVTNNSTDSAGIVNSTGDQNGNISAELNTTPIITSATLSKNNASSTEAMSVTGISNSDQHYSDTSTRASSTVSGILNSSSEGNLNTKTSSATTSKLSSSTGVLTSSPTTHVSTQAPTPSPLTSMASNNTTNTTMSLTSSQITTPISMNTSTKVTTVSSPVTLKSTESSSVTKPPNNLVEITTTAKIVNNSIDDTINNGVNFSNQTNTTTVGTSLTSPFSTQSSANISSTTASSINITQQTTESTYSSTKQSTVSSTSSSVGTENGNKSLSDTSTQSTQTSTFTTETSTTTSSVTTPMSTPDVTTIPSSEPEPTPESTEKVTTSTTTQTTTVSQTKSSTSTAPGVSEPSSSSSKPTTPLLTPVTVSSTPKQTPGTNITTKLTPTSSLSTESPKSEPEDYTTGYDKPSSEPETNPEGEGYPTSEPGDSTTNAQPEPEFNFDVFAEPGPDWPVAKVEWKQAWEFHVYFFGVAFILLGLYCFFCVIQLWKMEHLLSRHYFMTLQALVMMICLFRALYLLIDAYNSLGTFPIVLDYFLYSTVFPCLTAVFSILFYALLLAIRIRVMSEKIQKLWVLLVITGLHFALAFATDIVVGLFSTAAVMLIICQSFFILWGLIIFVGYLVIFKRVYKSAINRQEALRRNSTHERKNNITQGFQEKPPKQNYRLGLAVKVTLVSSFFGLAVVCFELYGLFGVYGIMRTDKPQPWPWWIYHSIVRCLEIAMCSSIAYVASQPLKYTYKKKYKDKTCLKALPCRYLCCADVSSRRDEVDVNMDQYAASETDALGWLKKLKLKKFSTPDINAPYPPHAAEKYSDPDATLLVRKINKPKPSMLVVEDGFVRIRREDEMPTGNQYDLESSKSSRSSGMNNVNNSPDINYTVNETQMAHNAEPRSPGGVSNAGFSQEDFRNSLRNEYSINPRVNNRISYNGDNRFSFDGELDNDAGIADETDIDIAVTDCENSDGYETPIPESDENSAASGDIFRPLSDIDLAASMESELERAFHAGVEDESSPNTKLKSSRNGGKSRIWTNREVGYNGQSNTDDDWSDSSDGPSRNVEAGLLRRPIRRCKSAETKEQQKSKMFDKNRYFSLSSIDSVGKQENQLVDFGINVEPS